MSVYYYTGTSGRVRFVKFNKVGGDWYTNERMPVKKSSIVGLKRFKDLVGTDVFLNGNRGKITGCNSVDCLLSGKYVGDNFYLNNSELLNTNHLVSVFWYDCSLPTWQPYFKMT